MLDAASVIVGLGVSLVRINSGRKVTVYVQHLLLLYVGEMFHYQSNIHFQGFQKISYGFFMDKILSFGSCKSHISLLQVICDVFPCGLALRVLSLLQLAQPLSRQSKLRLKIILFNRTFVATLNNEP